MASPWEAEASSAAGADDASGDGEDAEPEPLGFPPAGGFGLVEGEGLGPGEEVGGECDDLDPEPVMGKRAKGMFRRLVSFRQRIRSSQRAR